MSGGIVACSFEGGTGCPGADGGPHYFAWIDQTKDNRVCIDCGEDERANA